LNNPAFKIKLKSKPDPDFIKRYNDRVRLDDLKENEYRNQVFNNLINSSVPITDEEFKQLTELEQQVYNLYEYLINKDTFIRGEKINFKVKYFLVPSISIGTYSRKNKVQEISDITITSEKIMQGFRPRCNREKAEKYLYMNNEVAQYYRKYDEYGCLPGIYHSDATVMSGYMYFIESPPAVRSIYFSKKYQEASIDYDYQTENYRCLIKKNGNDWKLLYIVYTITAD